MSMNRQRPRTRVNSRANTIPSLSNTTVNTESTVVDFLPSIEESLQDWLSRSIPDTPTSSVAWLLDTCRCCHRNECENLETLSSAIRKLEGDSRLAAEIGQSLLHKHEQFLEELRDKVRELEQSLTDSDNSKQDLVQEKDRSIWEMQKTQKILDETAVDLETSNHRCLQLGSELKKSICSSFEKIKLDQQELGPSKDHQLDLVWLRESNEKLRKDVLKLTSALLVPNTADDLHMTNHNNTSHHLIELIKELASANNKLKTDLLDCSDLLMECRNDLYNKLDKQQDEIMHHDDNSCIIIQQENNNHAPTSQDDDKTSWLSTSAPQSNEESIVIVPRLRRTESKRSNKIDTAVTPSPSPPQPAVSLSTDTPAVVHHHYHYYMKNKLMAEKGKLRKSAEIKNGEKPPATLSPSTSSKSIKLDSSSPFRQLYHQVTMVLQRLQQTDIRALNRRLRRAFDILELSSMSNSIIENIVTDVDGLRTRFLWIEDCHQLVKQESWIHDISMLEFFPIIGLVQDMLKEIGQLRTTMNDLQVEYVKKVEESDTRLEEEILRKQQEKQQRIVLNTYKKTTLSSWLSNVFQRKQGEGHQVPSPQQQQQQDTNTRFIINNTSDISITTTHHPSSVHPLSTVTTEKSNMIAIIRRKKSDIDRHGPPSSFPTRSPAVAIGNEKNKRRSTATHISTQVSTSSPSNPTPAGSVTPKPFPLTLRASQSAGTVRRSKSMQAPALDYVVRRKRSTLGLSSSSSTDYDLMLTPQTTSPDMTGTFATKATTTDEGYATTTNDEYNPTTTAEAYPTTTEETAPTATEVMEPTTTEEVPEATDVFTSSSAIFSSSSAISSPTIEPTTSGSKSNTGAIAGGVVGGVAGVALIAAGIFFFLRKRRASSNDREVFQPEDDDDEYNRPIQQNSTWNSSTAGSYPDMSNVNAPPPPRHSYVGTYQPGP
ncbi:hypothetical protein INT47_013215 [Mucor saturninus]|uniref:Uncharacterized protein n=1 Tax=Mucor saturninus TaxID=64648 RepID=A0A8H7R1Z3_9FUNG|nr:hypothetical protein INT47_013215 [Mucor saturninus]